MENPVIIFGAKNTGKIAADIFNSNSVLIYGFLDDDTTIHNKEISEILVLGDPFDEELLKIVGNKTEAFIAVENKVLKSKLVKLLAERKKTVPVNAIHASAIVSEDAELEHGILIAPGAKINAGAKIKSYANIQTGAIIEVGAIINEYAEIGSGAIINSDVDIAEGAFVGSGAIVVSGIKIGKNARVGAGSVVIENVNDGQTVFGNPAKAI
jgi:sugar O-acyltransferase (sialic acid O-acetyltransferase NeuD family)